MIDVARLRELLRNNDESEMHWNLIAAAVNALPELLAVFEAACAWRDRERYSCGSPAREVLAEAIDAARGGGK